MPTTFCESAASTKGGRHLSEKIRRAFVVFDKTGWAWDGQRLMRPRVSLAIITFNEEDQIARCIESMSWADDVVVLDSRSTDRTKEIATQLGARVFVEDFRGYRLQKERATDLAMHDWVVSLDADEALSPELSQEILNVLELGDPQIDGFELPRLSFHMGRWIRHGGWFPDAQVRLFHRRRAKWTGGHVHERVRGVHVRRLKNSIFHWGFDDLSDQIKTNNVFSSKGALDLYDRGKRFSVLKLIFKPVSKFIETYIVKLGFLDGLPGFIISVGAAYSMFLKFAKLWELEQTRKKS